MNQTTPLSEVKGVGPALFKKLASANLKTVSDLINYYPRRYDDYSQLTPIAQLKPGQVSIKAQIKQAKGRYGRRGLHITEAVASDQTGSLRLVWFNQPYRATSLRRGEDYYISGLFELRHNRLAMTNPSVELVSEFPVHTARILPVYPLRSGLTSSQLRKLVSHIKPVITELPETLPAWLIKERRLMDRAQALSEIHGPSSDKALEAAAHRLGFEEVFQLVLTSLLTKAENQTEPALPIPFDEKLARQFVKQLPFKLTDDQRLSVWQIYQDMIKPRPMNRLVEGDVGSGKTAVAAMAALMVIKEGYQTALMAPTELLATQHSDTLFNLLKPLGHHKDLVLLTGSQSASQKKRAQEKIRSGQAKLIVGTQALIQEKIDMRELALVVIDEQHRFGVEQRRTLMTRAGHMPHLLSLSATPIPRSLALTLYGELDISVLRHKPPGRASVATEIVPPVRRDRLHQKLKPLLDKGQQMYVVCPLISDQGERQFSVEAVFENLKSGAFKDYRLGLLHGRLRPADKQGVMADFVNRRIDILVSTTVIEVGVDVPNASIMLIYDPERFGLAQLHQLRGRIGRGSLPGHCYLLLAEDKPASDRIRALESANDGFKLAELDLSIRGPGAIYGTLQHGPLDLRIAQMSDSRLISAARSSAADFISRGEDLLKYKELSEAVQKLRTVTSLN